MKKIFCALIAAATLFASTVPAFAAEVNTAPSTDIDGTKHRLVKSVKVYCADYDTNEWSLDYTQNVEYQNAYPTMIEQVYSDEELGSSKMLFEYTFENNLPKTSVIKNDADHETTKIEYNNGSRFVTSSVLKKVTIGFGAFIQSLYAVALELSFGSISFGMIYLFSRFLIGCRITVFSFSGATFRASLRYISWCLRSSVISRVYP